MNNAIPKHYSKEGVTYCPLDTATRAEVRKLRTVADRLEGLYGRPGRRMLQEELTIDFGPGLVHDDGELGIHRPARDGASGPLGHLGTCIAVVAPARKGGEA